MPDIKVPNIDIEKAAADLNNAVKEGAYVAVGLGVLGFQRAQVQRVELTKQLEAQLEQLRSLPPTWSGSFDKYLATVRDQAQQAGKTLEDALAPVREQIAKSLSVELPEIGNLTDQVSVERIEAQVKAFRAQFTELAKNLDEWVAPVRQQVDEQIDRIEETLPAPARDVVQTVRSAVTSQEKALRSAVGLD